MKQLKRSEWTTRDKEMYARGFSEGVARSYKLMAKYHADISKDCDKSEQRVLAITKQASFKDITKMGYFRDRQPRRS